MHFVSNSALCTSKRNKIDAEYITLCIVGNPYHLEYDVPVEQIILVNESLGRPHNPVPFFLHYGFSRVRETSEITSGSDFKYVYITVFFSDYIDLAHVMYRIIAS